MTPLPAGPGDGVQLAASLLFYTWGEVFHVAVMLASIAINYAAGRWIARAAGRRRAATVGAAVAANWLLLGWFKYAGFLGGIARRFRCPLAAAGPAPADRHFVRCVPGIVVGDRSRPRTRGAGSSAAWLALFIRAGGAGRPDGAAGVTGLLGLLGPDLYFDFSGYFDVAIGLGRRFELPENFRHPYAARSITFWRWWQTPHDPWFRDYHYVPLGGNRRGSAHSALNLLGIFLLCGLWHGAAWNFVVWGLYYGLLLALQRPWRAPGRVVRVGTVPIRSSTKRSATVFPPHGCSTTPSPAR